MKRRFLALKLYLIGLTAGLFVAGWSTIARTDANLTSTVANTSAQVITSQTSGSITTQSQTGSTQAITSQPRIRTRTS
jgi:hypothetical protein